MPDPIKVFSFGGGQQSVACLVLAAQGRIDYRTFLFCNVGDDSEHKATLTYVEQYAKPYAAEHGLELVELRRIMLRGPEKGQERTLLAHLKQSPKSIDIPVRMDNGSPGNRACIGEWKIQVVARETKRRGATKENPAIVGIGISVDEIQRAKDSTIAWQVTDHPLLDLRLRRTDCQRIIAAAGLPVPPKSACWFCPMKRPEDWHEMRRNEPDEFNAACDLEDLLNERRESLGKDDIFFTRFAQPLRQAIPDGVDLLPFADDPADGDCDSGYCFI
jgi:hypothetical protein